MSTSVTAGPEQAAALLSGIERARLAPSVLNSQPWIFHLGVDGVDLLSDSSRQLQALDPTGRELTMSCGAALLHLRIGLEALGYRPTVTPFPVPGRPDVLARLVPGSLGVPDPRAVALDHAADTRQTNRRGYQGRVSADDLEILQAAALRELAGLQDVADEDDRTLVKVLQQQANSAQTGDPAYLRELSGWVDAEPRDDGVPAASVTDGPTQVHDFAARDFAFSQHGGLTAELDAPDATVVVLYTDMDTPLAWLQAGQALARVWLEATRLGLVMQPLSQSVEEAGTRSSLRQELRLLGAWPQMILRAGHAEPQPASRRRSVGEVTVIDAAVRGPMDAERRGVTVRKAVMPHST